MGICNEYIVHWSQLLFGLLINSQLHILNNNQSYVGVDNISKKEW